MKILVYTISDFKPFAINCIDLLFSNLVLDNRSQIDFCIVTSKEHSKNIPDINVNVVVDDFSPKYIGFLKYSKSIPIGYGAYIYLDSDIIDFGSPVDLISSDKKFSTVSENLLMSNEWFKYNNAAQNHLPLFEGMNGLNAGSFCFKDILFLEKVRNLYEPFVTGDVHSDARLEQSSFNYAICQETNFDLSCCFDLSPITRLFASDYKRTHDKKLYHFCGFSNEMASKFYKMKSFFHEK